MTKRGIGAWRLAAALGVLAAAPAGRGEEPGMKSFGQDVDFLKQHTDVVVLSDASNQAKVALVGAYQGRVMTSTCEGDGGFSCGWINYEHIALGTLAPHINVFGGEDRFWMGPEGGQFAIFFPKGAPFDLEHWQTPPLIDTASYALVTNTATKAVFRKDGAVGNQSGAEFKVRVERTIRLLSRTAAAEALDVSLPRRVRMVAYESDNKVTNTGAAPWTKDSGLLSIWILGMYKHSPDTTVVIPFVAGDDPRLGRKVNDEYFGKVPSDRLAVKDDVVYFKGDGQYRSKIGLSPARAKPLLGSYNASQRLLTLVQYTKPEGVTDYVNSMWALQKEPFAGDVVNSYNDGPPAPDKKPLGPFYELETSSPAAALKPGEAIVHVHRTFHLTGSEAELDAVSRKTLGVGIAEIKGAF